MLTAFAAQLTAHPHMWIDYEIAPVVSDGVVRSVRATWVFDEFYSASFIMNMDTNRDGRFQQDEIDNIRDNAFRHLIDRDYFAKLRVNGQEFPVRRAGDFSARIVDGSVHYIFSIPVEQPARQILEIEVSFFDLSYFISFAPSAQLPVSTAGGLAVELSRQPVETVGWGTVQMQSVRLVRR